MENWKCILDRLTEGQHAVQYYTDDTFLARAVGYYIGQGLRSGQSAILVPQRCHLPLFEQAIESFSGRETMEWQCEGKLMIHCAEDALSSFTIDGELDWDLFEDEIGGTMQRLTAKGPARAYGEMVNLLWHWGERDAALLLEHFWNRLLQQGRFSLLCGYAIDPLAEETYDEKYHSVCGCHGAIIPAEDSREFDETIRERMQTVLGPALSTTVSKLAVLEDQREWVPAGQKYLLWLSRHMPATTKRVLSRTRAPVALPRAMLPTARRA